jgi:hypothetical protein
MTTDAEVQAGRRTVRAACAFVLVVMFAAACGGGGGGSASSSQASASGAASSSGATASSSSSGGQASGSDAGASTAADKGDLCRLVTKAEAESATGRSFGDPRSTEREGPGGTIGSCVYSIVTNGAASTIVNIIVLGTKITREQFEGQLASDAPTATSVDGVGEVALLSQPGALVVFDRGVVISVQMLVEYQPIGTDVLVTFARRALERL